MPEGRPIRWGILATGGIAAAFTEDLRQLPGAVVAAVASRSNEAAHAFATRHGIARAHGSWQALADDPGIDVVYVATPHGYHHPAVAMLLDAGRPVLCEKPLTVNSAQAQELVTLARRRGTFLTEAMWTLLNPAVRKAAELIADGAIGEIRSLHAELGWRTRVGPTHRLRDLAAGGGALLDAGVYPVALAHFLLGAPDRIQAHAHLTPEGVDEHTSILLGYDSGATAMVSCSFAATLSQAAVVYGTRGRIDFPPNLFNPAGIVLHRGGVEPEHFAAPPVAGHGYGLEATEVMRCLRSGETESPLLPLDGTLAVIRTLDSVRRRIGVRYPVEDQA
ncbi:Gfo/Idh/MocA family oxidoreductase [Streptomyces sp. ISL-66]|nr:Gfo/Idh/MocA family oxidoreductase [Streptomyces sp. ISL-66]MBT2470570.1 Gfo/Idh/MocA family oxidoreductase [Streptomyces sp. ISL-66]